MGAVGAAAPIKIILAKKYAVIVFCMNNIYSAWHVDSAPMMLNIFLCLCLVYDYKLPNHKIVTAMCAEKRQSCFTHALNNPNNG